MTTSRMVIPKYLRGDDVVVGHDAQPIGFWPFSAITAAKFRRLWGQRCRIWVDGGGEIIHVEKVEERNGAIG
jgi:hypothetical protein